ncbi:hypothetical protein HAX54_004787 [Datura stramonium]|uniref:Uncharacterized protein n=1 Tax=Datura stramonium TaxID=4076 RepID=A0ABS8T8U3_DATST|nr:hypothetical protein [Datura stramonium]
MESLKSSGLARRLSRAFAGGGSRRSGASHAASFHLFLKSDLDKLVAKSLFGGGCTLKSQFTSRQGSTCGVNSGEVAKELDVPLDLAGTESGRSTTFYNGWRAGMQSSSVSNSGNIRQPVFSHANSVSEPATVIRGQSPLRQWFTPFVASPDSNQSTLSCSKGGKFVIDLGTSVPTNGKSTPGSSTSPACSPGSGGDLLVVLVYISAATVPERPFWFVYVTEVVGDQSHEANIVSVGGGIGNYNNLAYQSCVKLNVEATLGLPIKDQIA